MASYFNIFSNDIVDQKLFNSKKNTAIFWDIHGNPTGSINSKSQLPPWGYLGFEGNTGAEVTAFSKPPPGCPPPMCYAMAIENFIVEENAQLIVSSVDNNRVEHRKAFPVAGYSDRFAFMPVGPIGELEYPVSIELTKNGTKSTLIIDSLDE